MKPQTLLYAVLFAAASSLSAGVFAADNMGDAKMAPHSHMQEKTGVAPKAAAPAAEEKSDAAAQPKKAKKSKDKHSHPRDGK